MQYTVTVAHDEEEGVWFVESSDVLGLNAEASTLDALVEVVADLVPDLIIANNLDGSMDDQHSILFRAEHVVFASRAPAA